MHATSPIKADWFSELKSIQKQKKSIPFRMQIHMNSARWVVYGCDVGGARRLYKMRSDCDNEIVAAPLTCLFVFVGTLCVIDSRHFPIFLYVLARVYFIYRK